MQGRLKNYALVICLFVLLFVIIGSGLHLNPSGAIIAAATGTPLVIYVFHRRPHGVSRLDELRADATRNEVAYVSSKRGEVDS